MALYALTNLLTALTTDAVSRATVTVVGAPALVLVRLSVTPLMTSLMLFDDFLTGSPSMVSIASWAAMVSDRCWPALPAGSLAAAAGSWLSRLDRPPPASSLTVIFMLDAAPVAELVSTSRLGEAPPSLTMEAVTPIFAPLIASRMPASDELFGPIVTVFASALPGVKTALVYLPVAGSF